MTMVGFVGLGNMGSGMAKNLLANNFAVLGFDIDNNKVASLEDSGLQKANGIREIAQNCKVVILCLPNPEVSKSIIFEQLLTDTTKVDTIVETSTLTPEIVEEFATKIKKTDKQFLSAPMIGGKNQAMHGTIEFLVEGSVKAFEDNQSIFDAMGSKSSFMGDIPSATLAKLAFNLSRYANLAVGVEMYRILEKYRGNTPAIYRFMSEQSLDNFGQVWYEDLKEMMTENIPFQPSQVPKKDLSLLAEMASNHDLNSELIEAIRKTYVSMEEA